MAHLILAVVTRGNYIRRVLRQIPPLTMGINVLLFAPQSFTGPLSFVRTALVRSSPIFP